MADDLVYDLMIFDNGDDPNLACALGTYLEINLMDLMGDISPNFNDIDEIVTRL